MNNELQLVESKETRERFIERVDVLEKVKSLTLMPDNIHTTTEMVSEYYEVSRGTLDSLISEHFSEISQDGYRVLKGAELKEFKGYLGNPSDLKFVSSLAIIPRRAMLRIGMLLRDSEVAKKIRTYLLNVEENTSIEERIYALAQNSDNKINALETKTLEIAKQQTWLVDYSKSMYGNQHEINDNINKVWEEINNLKSMVVFKQYVNPSYRFNDLVHRLGYKFNIASEAQHFTNFYKILGNWLGVNIPKMENTKQYVLAEIGMDVVEKLINGILIGRIILSDKDNWIDLNGYTQNDIELERTKKEFDYSCAYCGKSDCVLCPEHLIPQSSENSTDVIFNIVVACKSCNADKLNQKATIWYKQQPFFTQERFDKILEHWNKYYVDLSVFIK